MESNIVFGTSGYDYPEWRGIFYPENMDRKDFLPFYATKFSALEINFTYYKMPDEYQLRNMYQRSGGKLLFSVKATSTLTHTITQNWKDDALRFKAALLPLLNGGVLSAILFQFPQSFHYTNDNRLYLAKLLNEFNDYPSVVEFRQNEWCKESVYEGLDKMKAGFCVCDMPHLKALPAFIPIATGGIGYVRFHGRNTNNWYLNDSANGSARYSYLYSDKELQESVPLVKVISAKSKITHVFFNNHPDGGAAVNAKMMMNLF